MPGPIERNHLKRCTRHITAQSEFGVALEVEGLVMKRIQEWHRHPCLAARLEHARDFGDCARRVVDMLDDFQTNDAIHALVGQRQAGGISENVWPCVVKLVARGRIVKRDIARRWRQVGSDPAVRGPYVQDYASRMVQAPRNLALPQQPLRMNWGVPE